ncbi:MAG: hypothetical protein HY707_00555 [Ignavibacteriae bacterium]|nr:hypothetical protein [Ignavibacteriota bacterium]
MTQKTQSARCSNFPLLLGAIMKRRFTGEDENGIKTRAPSFRHVSSRILSRAAWNFRHSDPDQKNVSMTSHLRF